VVGYLKRWVEEPIRRFLVASICERIRARRPGFDRFVGGVGRSSLCSSAGKKRERRARVWWSEGARERRLILVPEGSGGRLDSFSASVSLHDTSRVFSSLVGFLRFVGPGGPVSKCPQASLSLPANSLPEINQSLQLSRDSLRSKLHKKCSKIYQTF
jgi:hypothetical protein